MGLYRKKTPDELLGATVLRDAPMRPIRKLSDIIVSPNDPRLGGNKVETRKGDRHKDRKAHSAKTAARAKAKRAAK